MFKAGKLALRREDRGAMASGDDLETIYMLGSASRRRIDVGT